LPSSYGFTQQKAELLSFAPVSRLAQQTEISLDLRQRAEASPNYDVVVGVQDGHFLDATVRLLSIAATFPRSY
jgi:hypothetical protein